MKKKALLNWLENKLENKKNYSYIVIDLRPWKKHTPDFYHSWIPED